MRNAPAAYSSSSMSAMASSASRACTTRGGSVTAALAVSRDCRWDGRRQGPEARQRVVKSGAAAEVYRRDLPGQLSEKLESLGPGVQSVSLARQGALARHAVDALGQAVAQNGEAFGAFGAAETIGQGQHGGGIGGRQGRQQGPRGLVGGQGSGRG